VDPPPARIIRARCMRRLPAHRAGHSFMLNFMQVR
jgi:hypothetical protein